MIFQLFYPKNSQLDNLILKLHDAPLSYPKPKNDEKIAGFQYDYNRILLGEGEVTWTAAKTALQNWTMFPGDWARIYALDTPLEVGRVVVMCARVCGFWWLNASRIVYVVDSVDNFGFAYGTLHHHAESGEELFQVSRDAEGKIWYEIKAFSRPRFWAARLAFPVARHFQRKFVKESLAHVKKMVHATR